MLRISLDLTLAHHLDDNEQSSARNALAFGSEIETIVMRLLLAANIAKPGALEIGDGYIFHQELWFRGTPRFQTDLNYAVEHVRKIGWPPLQELEVKQVLDWYPYESLYERPHPPSGPLVRAINAISYLIGETGPQSEVTALVYSLIGLEALYADSHEGIAEQINTKAQLFLGEMHAFKRSLKKMYNIRSRFLHGELDFPPSFYPWAESEYEANFVEVESSATLASMVLIATLQRMCERGLTELRFRMVLNEGG